jgi:hypothetical protein
MNERCEIILEPELVSSKKPYLNALQTLKDEFVMDVVNMWYSWHFKF